MIKLTVEPTRELIDLQGVTFRIYAGTDAHGVPVRMLVAALAVEGGAQLQDHEPLIDRQSAPPMCLRPSEQSRLAAALIRTGLQPKRTEG